ncbi:MAG: sulfate ABC transporter substrate-binding protein [Oscillospiraceae bacterium]|jgi:sulfate/thiosulfate-binding protein|nr:sulfate ABC transporter substrate-binding protein [Oscillospiraceae bacterium]
MKKKWLKRALALALVCVVTLPLLGGSRQPRHTASSTVGEITLTNVSYDPTRELYERYNTVFAKHYASEHGGKSIKIVQSHGGSGSQARSVIEGAEADVVTLALAHDVGMIQKSGLIRSGWEKNFAHDSAPYTSTIVFLVRKGNPKQIHDWNDLTRQGVNVITPDPKSSGGACWNFLAAWNYAERCWPNNDAAARRFVAALYANVTVMDSGARGSTTTFVENGQGDVLIAWENEAIASVKEHPGEYELVSPSVSILAQPSVAAVDENTAKHGTQAVSHEYLQYLYSDEAQRLIAQSGYRPTNPKVLKEYGKTFDLKMKLCTISDFGGWNAAYEKFFEDGGVFDDIYNK